MDLEGGFWEEHYLTYSHEVFGISAAKQGKQKLEKLGQWLRYANRPLKSFVASISPCLFKAKATAILSSDILALPYPETATLDISPNEQIIIDDVVSYYRDLIRKGDESTAMKEDGKKALPEFGDVFARQINAIYKKNPLRVLEPQTWHGVICQPFVFGEGAVDWGGIAELQGN